VKVGKGRSEGGKRERICGEKGIEEKEREKKEKRFNH